MNIEWKQPSTIRGLIWFVGGLVALAFLAADGTEKALTVLTITGSVAGGVGVALKD